MDAIYKEKLQTIKDNVPKVYAAGKAAGGDTEAAYNEGSEAGKKAVWEALQNHGEPMNYYYMFAYDRIGDEDYNPIYPIVGGSGTTPSQCIFYNNKLITDTKVEIIASENANACFYNMDNCITIRKFTVNEETALNNTFYKTGRLQNIEIGGTIGKNISFASCPYLTDESIQSIIDHLGIVAAARTITFHKLVVAKLAVDQVQQIADKGWSLG